MPLLIYTFYLVALVMFQKPESPPPPPPEEDLIEEDIYDEGISFKVSTLPLPLLYTSFDITMKILEISGVFCMILENFL